MRRHKIIGTLHTKVSKALNVSSLSDHPFHAVDLPLHHLKAKAKLENRPSMHKTWIVAICNPSHLK